MLGTATKQPSYEDGDEHDGHRRNHQNEEPIGPWPLPDGKNLVRGTDAATGCVVKYASCVETPVDFHEPDELITEKCVDAERQDEPNERDGTKRRHSYDAQRIGLYPSCGSMADKVQLD